MKQTGIVNELYNCRLSERSVLVSVLNNESVEYTDEFNPSDILGALRLRRWHIPSDQQVRHPSKGLYTARESRRDTDIIWDRDNFNVIFTLSAAAL